MRKIALVFVFCVSLIADWESDISSIKTYQQNFNSWKDDYLEGTLNGLNHVLLTGYDYSLTAGGDYTSFFWPDNYGSFWPEYKGSSYDFEDNSKDYLDYTISLTGIPTNWGGYPVGIRQGENLLRFDVFSDIVNNALDKMDDSENGYGISSIENSQTITSVNQVTNKVVSEFHDAISNVDDDLFVIDFSSLGEFYVNVCGYYGITVANNPLSDFVYHVSLIPDEIRNPFLYKLYYYWPLKPNGYLIYAFRVCMWIFCFIFMINKIKEILGGEWT